ncbi:MAG: PmoA family protein [Planctomycetia bacterium]|nr:PmoA family protein [Planctomycetia bacterium]
MNYWQQVATVIVLALYPVSPLLAQTVTPDTVVRDSSENKSSELKASRDSSPILVVPPRQRDLHIAIPLPPNSGIAADKMWQLVEVDFPESAIPAQVERMTSGDSPANSTSARLLAVIPPRVAAHQPRRFRLETAEAAKQNAELFAYREINNTSLGLWERERPVLVYNHGEVVNEKVPESDHRRARACYIHPVWGLNGEILTDDFPQDHFHHHGIFWAWPHVGIDGQEHDLWMYDTIKQRFVRWLHRETGPIASTLAVENGWFVEDKQVMIERVSLRVFKAGDDARVIDISLTWIPTEQAVKLQGAEGKSYGGLTIRFAPGSRPETAITVPSGRTEQDLPDTPLAWADLTAKFGGADTASGAALLVHPSHPNFPPTWLTRHYGPLCVGWPGIEPRTFPPGQPIHLDYRVWIHKSAVDLSRLSEAYEGYVAATKAAWE